MCVRERKGERGMLEKHFIKFNILMNTFKKWELMGIFLITLCMCPKDNILFCGKTLRNKGSIKIRSKARMPTISTSLHIALKGLANPRRQEESATGMIEKGENLIHLQMI